MNDTPWIEARTIDLENARETFALAARHVLADVAGDYHAVITVPELARQVQERTRIRNRQAPGLWIGDILFRVAKDCHRRAEPLLGSLVIGPDGRMPEWYADTVNAVRGDVVTSPEMHAATERLECYRRHGADLPADGGEPALPRRPWPASGRHAHRVRPPRGRARRVRRPRARRARRRPRSPPRSPLPRPRSSARAASWCCPRPGCATTATETSLGSGHSNPPPTGSSPLNRRTTGVLDPSR
ncbi:hypothetical protein [Nocardioides daphniae]|uniref:Uncharacterized protein n=1 Tax=Nocardioides daphniae TaxID=402297 RepID=A0A4P7U9R1_9ACTN|nr:hypothetical protein [Nocardioides daphniae]QCC76780.1 hypothetical protein E2C04_05300 [Nocardioides daphniae]